MLNICPKRREWLRDAAAIATIISMTLNLTNYFAGVPILSIVSVISLLVVLYYTSRPAYILVPRYQFDWNTIMGILYISRELATHSKFPGFKKQLINYFRTIAYCASIDGKNDIAEEFRKEADKLEETNRQQ